MFYKDWMSYLSDDAKITKIAIPGTHNSSTMGMNKTAKCQNGSLYKQYSCGIRFFDIRLKMTSKGVLHVAHGIAQGMPAKQAFENLKAILAESDEFFIFSIRTYMNQKIGPITLKYKGNTDETDRLISEYLCPEKYALTDYGDITELTMGDIRKSGKKYIIINKDKEYNYSCDCTLTDPWDAKVYGYKPEKFAKAILNNLRDIDSDGFFWLETQQTPNTGTENGATKWPDDLEKMNKPLFPQLIADIAAEPQLLEKANIIAGDFMTDDHMKVNHILGLNLLKGVIKADLADEFSQMIKNNY